MRKSIQWHYRTKNIEWDRIPHRPTDHATRGPMTIVVESLLILSKFLLQAATAVAPSQRLYTYLKIARCTSRTDLRLTQNTCPLDTPL